jgi:hypothetical protein
MDYATIRQNIKTVLPNASYATIRGTDSTGSPETHILVKPHAGYTSREELRILTTLVARQLGIEPIRGPIKGVGSLQIEPLIVGNNEQEQAGTTSLDIGPMLQDPHAEVTTTATQAQSTPITQNVTYIWMLPSYKSLTDAIQEGVQNTRRMKLTNPNKQYAGEQLAPKSAILF